MNDEPNTTICMAETLALRTAERVPPANAREGARPATARLSHSVDGKLDRHLDEWPKRMGRGIRAALQHLKHAQQHIERGLSNPLEWRASGLDAYEAINHARRALKYGVFGDAES